MARPILVGPLRLWAEHGSGGDILIAEHDGRRYRYPRSDRSARATVAWQAYRLRDIGSAASFPYLPQR